jgi:hypothetical protein
MNLKSAVWDIEMNLTGSLEGSAMGKFQKQTFKHGGP